MADRSVDYHAADQTTRAHQSHHPQPQTSGTSTTADQQSANQTNNNTTYLTWTTASGSFYNVQKTKPSPNHGSFYASSSSRSTPTGTDVSTSDDDDADGGGDHHQSAGGSNESSPSDELDDGESRGLLDRVALSERRPTLGQPFLTPDDQR